MTGHCVIVTKGDAKTLYNVSLVDSKAGVDPVDAIKEYCKQMGTLPWPIEDWDDHEKDIQWFPVRDVEKLKSIDWSIDCVTMEEAHKIQIQVYRAFEIYQVDYVKALEALDNEVIDRALGLGWEPKSLSHTLETLAWAMEERDQAEIYREGIMAMVEDVAEAVEATEEIYQYDADNFLEGEDEPEGPKKPKDMTDEELNDESQHLHVSFLADNCATEDVLRHNDLERELLKRDYEIRVCAGYTVQKREEE